MFGRIKGILTAVMMLLSLTLAAQSTRIKGRVTDAETGEGVPFAGIYFKGTTVGVSSDMDGYYTIETRDPGTNVICASILGYDPLEKEVRLGTYQELNFKLKLTNNALNASLVKPDNSRIQRLMAKIDEYRRRNNPEKRKVYQCDIYTKMELDINNAEDQIRNKKLRKNFGFIFDYMDTSVVTGRPFLPIMISETISHRYHKDDPVVDKEVIDANQISGINDEGMISQFTGGLHLKTNFYNNFISAFNVDIPSPLSPNGMVYYNYYIIDSLQIGGRKTYNIRFHPKKMVSSPVFDGEMNIDADDYGLQQIHAKLKKGSNVNWVRDLIIDVENQRVGDSTWFYKQDNLFVDFSVVMKDSSNVMSFLGRRQMNYSNPEFSKPLRKEIVSAGDNVTIKKDANSKSAEYWEATRPYKLTQKEENIYSMVDSIKNVPMFRDLYTIVATFVSGFYDHGKLSYGPVYKFFSFNNLEGARLQFGGRTSNEFSKKFRITAYAAFGTKDKKFKGGGSLEYMFSKQPTSKLTLSARRDVLQLGKGKDAFTESNIMSSILSKGNSQKLSPVNEYSLQYDQELHPGINVMAAIESRTIFSNKYVPMIRPDGTSVTSVASQQAHLSARFSWDEIVTRGSFVKTYVQTDYPVITIDLIGAVKGLAHNDYGYARTELSLSYRLPIPPVGFSRFRLNVGKIFGTVPYPLLKLHEGNGTYFLDKSAFSCMDFYEFASDTWATLFYEHNFNGFFVGKIPLLRRMQLREVFTLKTAYGTLSKRNNGIIDDPESSGAQLLFPKGMSSLNKPYVEMGLGITNILRLFRVDMFWRANHRYRVVDGVKEKVDNRFAVNFGIELQF